MDHKTTFPPCIYEPHSVLIIISAVFPRNCMEYQLIVSGAGPSSWKYTLLIGRRRGLKGHQWVCGEEQARPPPPGREAGGGGIRSEMERSARCRDRGGVYSRQTRLTAIYEY